MLENSTYTTTENGQIILSKQDYEKMVNLVNKYAELQLKTQYLQQELDKLKRMIFGAKSERFVPVPADQLALFDLESKQKQEPQSETLTYTRNKPEQKTITGHGRLLLPAHLPRVDHVIEPEGKVEGAKKIGEEITEVLEYTPGKLYVNRYIRPKYVLSEEKGIVIGLLPSLPIPRGNAGAGLLAHIMVSKYVDHLPFYRQVQQFKREEIHLSESTLNGWFTGGCKLIEPLYEHHKKQVQQAQYLMADETPIPVQTKDKPGSTHKGYLWVYYAPLERLVLFDYRKSRSREGPVEFLKDFKGILQTDGYEAYRIFENKQGITLLACMAHARRKFDEAKGNDPERAQYMLALMQQLYAVEREAREKELSYEDRKSLRQEKSVAVLQQMEQWMKQEIQKVLPQSAIGKAIAYTLSLWSRLIRYTEDGRAEIDNNLVENSIRPVAVGRKNYLFAGSHEGAGRAALIYSMLGTCKQHNVNPFLWLRDVFTCLPETKQSELDKFLPQNWTSESN